MGSSTGQYGSDVNDETYWVRVADELLGAFRARGEIPYEKFQGLSREEARWSCHERSLLSVLQGVPSMGPLSEVAEWRQGGPMSSWAGAHCRSCCTMKYPDRQDFPAEEWSAYCDALVLAPVCSACVLSSGAARSSGSD